MEKNLSVHKPMYYKLVKLVYFGFLCLYRAVQGFEVNSQHRENTRLCDFEQKLTYFVFCNRSHTMLKYINIQRISRQRTKNLFRVKWHTLKIASSH